MKPDGILDRTTYKKIKSMDREQMQNFASKLYTTAYNDAMESIDLETIRERISKINGIGEKRLEEIMNIISEALKQ